MRETSADSIELCEHLPRESAEFQWRSWLSESFLSQECAVGRRAEEFDSHSSSARLAQRPQALGLLLRAMRGFVREQAVTRFFDCVLVVVRSSVGQGLPSSFGGGSEVC